MRGRSLTAGAFAVLLAASADGTTHDPHGRVGNESDYLRFAMLYDVLAVTDENGAVQPRLAASWEPDGDDLTRWTVTLGENAVFSDGDPVTADDVLFSLERTLDPGPQAGESTAAETGRPHAVGASARSHRG